MPTAQLNSYTGISIAVNDDPDFGSLIAKKIRYLNPASGVAKVLKVPLATTPAQLAKLKAMVAPSVVIQKVKATHIGAGTKEHDGASSSAPKAPPTSKINTGKLLVKAAKLVVPAGKVITSYQWENVEELNPHGIVGGKIKLYDTAPAELRVALKAVSPTVKFVKAEDAPSNLALPKQSKAPPPAKTLPSKDVTHTTGAELAKAIVAASKTFSVVFPPLILKKIALLNPKGTTASIITVPLKCDSKMLLCVKSVIPPSKGVMKVNAAAQLKKNQPQKTTTGYKSPYAVKSVSPGDSNFLGNVVHGPGVRVGDVVRAKPTAKKPSAESISAHVSSLLPHEKGAISTWKGSPKSIRAAFATGEHNEKSKAMLGAITKAPKVSGTLYRGIKVFPQKADDYGLKQIQAIVAAGVGGTWTDPSPHGMSRSPSVSISFANGGLLLRVKTDDARSIESAGGGYAAEKEAIGMPGSVYKITGIVKGGIVKDLEPPPSDNPVKLIVDLELVK